MKRFVQLFLILIALMMLAGVVTAAPPAQGDDDDTGQVYIVQPGDGLIQLARKFFGDGTAFTRIVAATNALAATDSSFREISDPNVILVGEKLWIPGLAELPDEDETTAEEVEEQEEPMADEQTADEVGPLAGTSWMLTALNEASPLPNTAITLDFVDEITAGGSSGCNSYSTTYETEGIRISFGATAGTAKACLPLLMAQELSYLEALSAAAFYEVSDQMLRLFDADTTLLAEFEPASSELAGSAWDVISYNNGKEAVVSVLLDTALTAVFDADGQVSGSAGCNTYLGPYTTDGDAITIGPLAATRKLCADPEVMDQEEAYLTAMETAATYKITGDMMEMRTEDGALVATFSRMEEAEE